MKSTIISKVLLLFLTVCYSTSCSETKHSVSLSSEANTLKENIVELIPSHWFEKWDIWKKDFSTLTNVNEKLILLEELACHLEAYDYSKLPTREARMSYEVGGEIFSWMQDQYFVLTKDREKVMDVWFREMEFFQKEHKVYASGQKNVKERSSFCLDHYERCVSISNIILKTYYYIDFERCRAHIYCTEHPEKKKAFLRRVKKVLGRYPEWYKEEK